MSQIVQIAGAVAILVPFVLAQFRVLGTQSLLYILLNFIGSVVLALLALQGRQWGFVLLEGMWALVSLWGLVTLARRRKDDAGVAAAMGRAMEHGE